MGAWKVQHIHNQLQLIHPTFVGVLVDEDGEIWMQFSDGDPMYAGEFYYGSQTRELLDELEDLLLRREDGYEEEEG